MRSSLAERSRRRGAVALIRVITAGMLVAIGPGLLAKQSQPRGTVRVELRADPRLPITSQQQWAQRLAQAGITRFRIATGRDGDKAEIITHETALGPEYVVIGLIALNEEIVVPGARFRATELGRFAAWLDQLARSGVPASDRSPAADREQQLRELAKLVAKPVGFDTKNVARNKVVEKLLQEFPVQVQVPPNLGEQLGTEQVTEQLCDLSCGTALAYLIRPAGLALVPRPDETGMGLAIIRPRPDEAIWPIGWRTSQRVDKLVPNFFQYFEVRVNNVPLTDLLQAVEQRLQVPFLFDYNNMAQHGIDPAKTLVRFPPKRTNYSVLLRHCLFQAKLKYELRVDEAGKPFFWITVIEPLSR